MEKKKITPLSAVAGVLMLLGSVLPLGIFIVPQFVLWGSDLPFDPYLWVEYSFGLLRLDGRPVSLKIGIVLSYVTILISVISAVFVLLNKRNHLFTAHLAVQLVHLIYFGMYVYHLLNNYYDFYFYNWIFNWTFRYLLFIVIVYLSFAVINFLCIRNQTTKVANLWWTPFALTAVVSAACSIILLTDYSRALDYLVLIVIPCLVMVAVTTVAMFWLTQPNREALKEQKKARREEWIRQQQATTGGTAPQAVAINSEAYYDMAKHVLLLLLTCGIYMYVWIYRMTKYTNDVPGEEYRDPTKKLLLCMFVPFYSVYWIYKTAQRIDKLAAAKGVQSDIATLCLILALFVGIVPPIIMQDKMNHVVTAPTRSAPIPSAAVTNTPDELKKYKDLLDSGAITQDEYNAKKSQLLGL